MDLRQFGYPQATQNGSGAQDIGTPFYGQSPGQMTGLGNSYFSYLNPDQINSFMQLSGKGDWKKNSSSFNPANYWGDASSNPSNSNTNMANMIRNLLAGNRA